MHRIISGFHTEVSTHIAANYPVEEVDDPNIMPELGPSKDVYYNKIGHNSEYKHNLQFTLVVLLRALNKASSVLSVTDFDNDMETTQLVGKILDHPMVRNCGRENTFDEHELFQRSSGDILREQTRT
eukprot:UN32003